MNFATGRKRETAPPLKDTRKKEPTWKVTPGASPTRPAWDVTKNPDKEGCRILCSTTQPNLERDTSKHARSLWKIEITEGCGLGGGETAIAGDIVFAPSCIAGLLTGRGRIIEEITNHY